MKGLLKHWAIVCVILTKLSSTVSRFQDVHTPPVASNKHWDKLPAQVCYKWSMVYNGMLGLVSALWMRQWAAVGEAVTWLWLDETLRIQIKAISSVLAPSTVWSGPTHTHTHTLSPLLYLFLLIFLTYTLFLTVCILSLSLFLRAHTSSSLALLTSLIILSV